MKKFIYQLLVLYTFGFFSCSKSDPINVTLLTFQDNTVYPNTVTEKDNWIYVTDEDGTILDVKPTVTGQPVTLQTTKKLTTQRINVTYFRYSKFNTGSESSGFTTYLGVVLNDSWVFDSQSSSTSSNPVKNVTLALTNYSGNFPSHDHTVSNKRGIISHSRSLASTTLTFTFDASDAPTFYVTTYKNNQPVYKEITNQSNVNSFTADVVTDLKAVDHILDMPALSGSNLSYGGSISGIRNSENSGSADGYFHSFVLNSSSPVKMGYNDGFDTYKTQFINTVSIATQTYYRTYYKLGQPPASISILNYTGSATNTSYNNFAFTISGNYDYRYSSWNWEASTLPYQSLDWVVLSPSDGKQNITNIPTEITTKHPNLQLGSLKYLYSTFTRYLDGFTYDDYVGSIMKRNSGKKLSSTESQTVRFNN